MPESSPAYRVALVVLSDKAAAGTREDACLPAMRAGLPAGCTVVAEHVLPDDRAALEALLRDLCDVRRVDGILTSGGTGLSPRDVTPQATGAVADYEVPGIPEIMRLQSAGEVPTAVLSRAVAAVRKQTLIVNLPGSPAAVRRTLGIIAPVLPHAFDSLRGSVGEHSVQA
jgi:molybdopterin adenylyltransferase